MTNNNAAPGWYPVDDRNERYWDGAAWTAQQRPMQALGQAQEPTQQFAPMTSGSQAGFPGENVNPGSGGGTNAAAGAPDTAKQAWYRRGWVIGLAALLVGIIIGSAAAGGDTTDPKTSDEYKTVAGDLKDTKSELASTKADLKDLAGNLPQREAQLKKNVKSLDARQAQVKKDEAAVKAASAAVTRREKKVGVVEKTIKANTISGDGTYEVGKDMKAGTYRSDAPSSGNCYYAVNSDANGNNIDSNNNSAGPSVVTVTNGKFFETSGCEEWVLSR